MTDKYVLVDFGGTLIRPGALDEANRLRSKVLERALPTEDEHAQSDKLYANNRNHVEALTGLTDEMLIDYTNNSGQSSKLSGVQVKNQIATNLFQLGMYMAAARMGLDVFAPGMPEQLSRIHAAGYRIAIVSGVRTDIISGMLAILGDPFPVDRVLGQPPVLGVSNEEQMSRLSELGDCAFVVGDKLSDLEPAKELGAQTVFVTWGHPSGGERDSADFVVERAEQLADIIR